MKNHLNSFFPFLLQVEITLFKQGKIRYLLNILKAVVKTILFYITLFFAVYGVFSFCLINFYATVDISTVSAPEIIIDLNHSIYPLSLFFTGLKMFIRCIFRMFNYFKCQWMRYSMEENYE